MGVQQNGDSILVTYGETYGSMPTPVKTNNIHSVFKGWFTEKEGGTKITSETIVTATDDHTLYAHWSKYTGETDI